MPTLPNLQNAYNFECCKNATVMIIKDKIFRETLQIRQECFTEVCRKCAEWHTSHNVKCKFHNVK